MQEVSTSGILFARLIFGYVTIALVTVLAAWISINRIENQITAAPILYERALFNKLKSRAYRTMLRRSHLPT